jgi:hypothetical protein
VYVKDRRANVSEAVFPMSWNNKRLTAGQDHMILIDPHLGFPCDHGKDFLHGMPMRRCSGFGRYPLFEYAKRRCAVAG